MWIFTLWQLEALFTQIVGHVWVKTLIKTTSSMWWFLGSDLPGAHRGVQRGGPSYLQRKFLRLFPPSPLYLANTRGPLTPGIYCIYVQVFTYLQVILPQVLGPPVNTEDAGHAMTTLAHLTITEVIGHPNQHIWTFYFIRIFSWYTWNDRKATAIYRDIPV